MTNEEKDNQFCRFISTLAWDLARSRFAVVSMVKAEHIIHIRTGTDKNIFITITMKGNKS